MNVLSGDRIRELFAALDRELAARSVVGEVGILGGAVMCLVFQARESTKDIDAVFAPTQEIRDAALAVARAYGVAEDWHDADDVAFLVRRLGLVTPEEVFERITRYYPREQVPPRTRFLVEELLGAAGRGDR